VGYVPVEDWDGHSGEFARVRCLCCLLLLLLLLWRRLFGLPLLLSVADTWHEEEEASNSKLQYIDIDTEIVRLQNGDCLLLRLIVVNGSSTL